MFVDSDISIMRKYFTDSYMFDSDISIMRKYFTDSYMFVDSDISIMRKTSLTHTFVDSDISMTSWLLFFNWQHLIFYMHNPPKCIVHSC